MPWIKYQIYKCQECPFSIVQATPGAGCAIDRFCNCKKTNNKQMHMRKIGGYIEWDSEEPAVPDWCPIRVDE